MAKPLTTPTKPATAKPMKPTNRGQQISAYAKQQTGARGANVSAFARNLNGSAAKPATPKPVTTKPTRPVEAGDSERKGMRTMSPRGARA